MEPFTVHTGRAVPLRRSNVDTDQIIPAEYLKRVSRSGFADGLFKSWREDPGFVLNDPAYAGATVLLAGPDFGTGSSREHAVWALQDYGFRAILSARFGDIFRGNALKGGLLPVQLPSEPVERLQVAAEEDPATEITVDLVDRECDAEVFGWDSSWTTIHGGGSWRASTTSDSPCAEPTRSRRTSRPVRTGFLSPPEPAGLLQTLRPVPCPRLSHATDLAPRSYGSGRLFRALTRHKTRAYRAGPVCGCAVPHVAIAGRDPRALRW